MSGLRVRGGAAPEAADLRLQVVEPRVNECDFGAQCGEHRRVWWSVRSWHTGLERDIGEWAGPAGGALVGVNGNQPAEPDRKIRECDEVTARRTGRARWQQVAPSHQAPAGVGQPPRGPSARTGTDPHSPHPLSAVTQAALVTDEPAGCHYFEQHRRPVCGGTTQCSGLGKRVQAIEAAATPTARRGVPPAPDAGRLRGRPINALRAD